jgi:hypothetical protein
LIIASTGSIVDSDQNHLLGTYMKVSEDGPDGRFSYKQQDSLMGLFLYLTPIYNVRNNSRIALKLI